MQPGRSPRASVSSCGDRCPSPPPSASPLVGRSLEIVGGLRGGLGEGPGVRPVPALPPPCLSQVPENFPVALAAPSERVLIIDGAGSVPWRFVGPSPPAFLEVEASSLVASPHPGPWCPSHPRQTRPEGELVREGGGQGRRGTGSLVSPPSPLRRLQGVLSPQFPVKLGESLLVLLPVSLSPGPGPLVSPWLSRDPSLPPQTQPAVSGPTALCMLSASSWSGPGWGTTGVPYAGATSWGGGGPGDLEAAREVVGGEGWSRGW